MAAKMPFVEKPGDTAFLLPELITRGLAANERLKYYLTLIQAAQAHAVAPHRPAPNLRVQREASGVDDYALDHVIEASVNRGASTIYIPGSCSIIKALFDEVRDMVQPLKLASPNRSELQSRVDIYQRRLDDLVMHAASCTDDQLTAGTINTLIALSENGHDTLHQLVIDLHWELNRLEAGISVDSIDGAHVYSLLEPERRLVRTFMKGVHQTASLKLDLPGLDTVAMHEGNRLTIRNDLSGSLTHFVVVHVSGFSCRLTYTDTHYSRIRFFQDLLQPFGVSWEAGTPATDFEAITGHYTADSVDAVERYLTFVGSRLVFLIGWNRARKRLSRLLGKPDAVGLLKWAAENDIGHVAFLKAGDIRLIEGAFERAAPSGMWPGSHIDEWLGRDGARTFLMSVLRITATALASGHSMSLIEDEVEAELLRCVSATRQHKWVEAADHAAMLSALADRVRRTLIRQQDGDSATDGNGSPADQMRAWTAEAGQIVRHANRRLLSTDDERHLRPLLMEADMAADALEEAAFLATLVPRSADAKVLSLMGEVADVVTETVREYVRCLEESRDLTTSSLRPDVDRFLLAIDRLVERGRQARSAKRAITSRLLHGPAEPHDVYVITTITQAFERAAMALGRCGPLIRDHVLGTWVNQ